MIKATDASSNMKSFRPMTVHPVTGPICMIMVSILDAATFSDSTRSKSLSHSEKNRLLASFMRMMSPVSNQLSASKALALASASGFL